VAGLVQEVMPGEVPTPTVGAIVQPKAAETALTFTVLVTWLKLESYVAE
jgi:hypothetical protein